MKEWGAAPGGFQILVGHTNQGPTLLPEECLKWSFLRGEEKALWTCSLALPPLLIFLLLPQGRASALKTGLGANSPGPGHARGKFSRRDEAEAFPLAPSWVGLALCVVHSRVLPSLPGA